MNDLSSLSVRLFFGLTMLIAHGLPKLTGGDPSMFPDPLGMGPQLSYWMVFAEVVCAGLFAAGLFSRLFSIPLMVTMAVAALIVHANDPFMKQEKAILYFAGYLAIFLNGSGAYSLQQVLGVSSHKKILRFLLK